ncbi:HEPN domain-containing protein [Dyella psychrodurans]|uniref:Uncharacterized protein n=1 Tax=Dyella psychrodurans TaxID=1927960 RepID=A0A370X7C1_9GAMM|nr:HEPN domain-containing protein [Dyella psychrodurans]RDS84167.1 hypothetical protein DWU99_10460 [Dyella psychrodurans]
MPNSFLYLNGLSVPRVVNLTDTVELRPAVGVSDNLALKLATCSEDAAVYLLTLPRITSELRITSANEEDLAPDVWNAGWDALLLGAVFACPIDWPIESECSAADVNSDSSLRVTQHHLHGWRHAPHTASEEDCAWLDEHFVKARAFLKDEIFRNAVHCLASFHWHPHPRPRLALLWAGIEALFDIDSELSFRLSLLAARFLEPNDRDAARVLFTQIKDLYKVRSKAVHGGRMKGDTQKLIGNSAALLQRLLRRCIETESLPVAEELVL